MTNNVDKEFLWRQYQINIDLYKHYLELTLKFNVFYYAVTGAILSFYFSQSDINLIRFALLLPIVMSIGFGIFFFYGAKLMAIVRVELFEIRDALEFYSAPDVNVLSFLLRLSALLFFVVAFCLLFLMIWRS